MKWRSLITASNGASEPARPRRGDGVGADLDVPAEAGEVRAQEGEDRDVVVEDEEPRPHAKLATGARPSR